MAVISPVVVVPTLDLSFGKYLLFRAAVELAAILVLGDWVFRNSPGVTNRARIIATHPVVLAMSAFSAVSLLSTAFAFDRPLAFWSTYSRGEGTFQLLHYLAFLFLAALLFREPRDWRQVLMLSLAAAFVSIAYGLLWPAGVPASVYPQDLPIPDNSGFLGRLMGHRFVGSIGNPIWSSSYFAFQLGYLAWLLTERRTAGSAMKLLGGGVTAAAVVYGIAVATIRGYTMLAAGGAVIIGAGVVWFVRRRHAVAAIAAIAALAFAFLLAGSRGPMVAAVTVAIGSAMFLVRSRWRIATLLAAAAICGFFVIRGATLVPQLQGRLILDTTSADYRIQYWRTAWEGFLRRPLLGWGPENFSAIHDRYSDILWWVDHAHSSLFDTLAATGAIGTVASLAVLAACGWVVYRAIPLLGQRVVILAALIGFYVIQSLFTFDWLPVSVNLYLTMALLVCVTARRDLASAKPARRGVLTRAAVAVPALVLVCWAGNSGGRLPLAKALLFQDAVSARIENWDECRESFDRSFSIAAPFGQDELVQSFGVSIANLLRNKKRNAAEVVLWTSYFQKWADPLIANGGAHVLRTLQAAGLVETAAYQATGDPAYFAAAESHQRQGLAINPRNLMILRDQFDLYSAAGKTDDARRCARIIQAMWPSLMARDEKIESAARQP